MSIKPDEVQQWIDSRKPKAAERQQAMMEWALRKIQRMAMEKRDSFVVTPDGDFYLPDKCTLLIRVHAAARAILNQKGTK